MKKTFDSTESEEIVKTDVKNFVIARVRQDSIIPQG